jgi:hypothetical protein
MPHSSKKLTIESLQIQLQELKTVYDEMIKNNKEFDSVKPIQIQILELEKTIREYKLAES